MSLEVIVGPMFSGKTSELLRRIRREQIAKRPHFLFKPRVDHRYSPIHVVTHDSVAFNAHVISMTTELDGFTADHCKAGMVVGVDEVQLMPTGTAEILERLAFAVGCRVIVAGLDLDSGARPFEPLPRLMALADDVLKLAAVCVKCGAPATRTYRTAESTEVVLVGGAEEYEARCVPCYGRGHADG